MITNNFYGIGTDGVLEVGPNPRGGVLYVNSSIGLDSRGRVTFPGAAAGTTGGGVQGPQTDPTKPLATLAFALTFTQAGRGDIIIIQPGHTETLTANVTCSNSGVIIYGQGNPDIRPVFTMATFSLILSGVGAAVINCVFNSSTNANTSGVVQCTGAGAGMQNCKIISSEVTTVGVALAAARTYVVGSEIDATTTGLAVGIQLSAVDGIVVQGNLLRGIFATAPIDVAAATNLLISGNTLRQLSGSATPVISGVVTATSGMVTDNRFQSVAATTVAAFLAGTNVTTNTGVIYLQNYGFKGKAGPSSGLLIPAVGTIP